MKFYLDEDVDISLAEILTSNGHEVCTTLASGNRGANDESQLNYATRLDAVLITHNRRHFRRLHRTWTQKRKRHSGIIISRHLPLSELERRMMTFLISVFGQNVQGTLFDLRDFA